MTTRSESGRNDSCWWGWCGRRSFGGGKRECRWDWQLMSSGLLAARVCEVGSRRWLKRLFNRILVELGNRTRPLQTEQQQRIYRSSTVTQMNKAGRD
ncbi:hypothetical protein Tsubulata_038952 [Turnera subulata]|uniref:Uncharacterized protein n=1 Tax=Turnera subulata TaxID=218843 RepID=A0A9Q0GH81_9ROSI|nr:hypothetical protein Tsubulata_038952 [Turnera subulata]